MPMESKWTIHGAHPSVAGDEGSYLPNCQSNLVIALHALSILIFLNTHSHPNGFYWGHQCSWTLSQPTAWRCLLFCNFINTIAYLWADTSSHFPIAVALPELSLTKCDSLGCYLVKCRPDILNGQAKSRQINCSISMIELSIKNLPRQYLHLNQKQFRWI